MTANPPRTVPVTLLVPEPLAVEFQLQAAQLMRNLMRASEGLLEEGAERLGDDAWPLSLEDARRQPGFKRDGARPWAGSDVDRAAWVLKRLAIGPTRFLAYLALHAPEEVPAEAIAKAAGYENGAKSLTALTGILSMKSRQAGREWAFVWCGREDGDTKYKMKAETAEAFLAALDEVRPGLREEMGS